ncbi:TetR/AcrR family transcriptional regulator [Planomonospora parontospora]|uniref:TetR/AcrR family transcriptional regulator n=1 Tax=Planomonospora parontospora TaxID=58119 RepID=UPI0016703071|nr:TetR/AcrR family transcriptional regulator [Planomonospora parontospora]GGL02616.1 TetR family transcriptional regulator [Planomonospora parontospora subsp. antibiotica]GII16726.1 TetR family transcriptional regulator [Planomonospora parontospora subsp. antibiotica]
MAATRRIERTQESRRLLVTAAAELFAEKGYRQTSFIDIAERAGISRGSIPWHFGNKLGLLEAVVDDRLQAVLTALPPIPGELIPGELIPGELPGDPLDQVMDFIRLPATRLFITLLAEAVEAGSPIREHYARLHAALRQAVRARIPAEALPPGTTSEALTVLLVGAVIGVHAQWRVAPEAVDLEAVRATVRALLPTGLRLA